MRRSWEPHLADWASVVFEITKDRSEWHVCFEYPGSVLECHTLSVVNKWGSIDFVTSYKMLWVQNTTDKLNLKADLWGHFYMWLNGFLSRSFHAHQNVICFLGFSINHWNIDLKSPRTTILWVCRAMVSNSVLRATYIGINCWLIKRHIPRHHSKPPESQFLDMVRDPPFLTRSPRNYTGA